VRIIGVVDLRAGRAVHARGGVRDRYQPVVACGDVVIDGDPIALASTYRDALHVPEIYVADIDAISGEEPSDGIVDALIGLGLPLWLDSGISTLQRAQDVINRGVSRVVVGLETLPSFDALDVICISVGGHRVAFSLDMKNGVPILAQGSGLKAHGTTPAALAARATRAGVGAIIVLDLARVGLGGGVDVELIRSVRAAAPDVMLLAGGGVRGEEDLALLSDAGCDGVLAATMLQRVRSVRLQPDPGIADA
jgi:phosphoribosylformimino-5-aminoimidazole carboxamide ribotide isomerase